jgi:periplasmic protein TonB
MRILDRMSALALLALALVPSAAIHLLWISAASAVRPSEPPPPPAAVRIVVVEPPPPPEPVAVPQAPGPAALPRPRRPAPRAPAPEQAAPPPPPSEVAPVETAPPLLAGVALSATTSSGSVKVTAGNGAVGQPSGKTPGSGGGSAAEGPTLVPGYALSEQPVFLDNVSLAQLRRFYPEEARKAKLESAVRVLLTIDKEGAVVRVRVLSDPGHGFGNAAARVARLYRFKPARLGGQAVATEIQFTIHFELE